MGEGDNGMSVRYSSTGDAPELAEAKAPSARLQVIAAKVPRVCIIRAFTCFGSPSEMVDEVLRYVGSMNPEVEWTAHTYEGRPFYWHDIVGVSPYGGGVYRWDYSDDGYQGRDSNRYRKFVGLLHRPTGWGEIAEGNAK